MHIRRLLLVASAIGAIAACGRSSKNADTASATTASAENPTARSAALMGPPGEPPPPTIDTMGTLYIMDASMARSATTTETSTAAAPARVVDSVVVLFQYDTAGTADYKATFSTTQRDSVVVAPGSEMRSSNGGTRVTGSGRITARTARGTIVVDLPTEIRGNSSMGRCQGNAPPGRGRCGVVMLDSVQYTPRTGGAPSRRRARLDLGS